MPEADLDAVLGRRNRRLIRQTILQTHLNHHRTVNTKPKCDINGHLLLSLNVNIPIRNEWWANFVQHSNGNEMLAMLITNDCVQLKKIKNQIWKRRKGKNHCETEKAMRMKKSRSNGYYCYYFYLP